MLSVQIFFKCLSINCQNWC